MSNRADFKYDGHVKLDEKTARRISISLPIKDVKVNKVTILSPIMIDLEADGVPRTISCNMDFSGRKLYIDGYNGDVEQLTKAVFDCLDGTMAMRDDAFVAPPEYHEMARKMQEESGELKERSKDYE